MPGDVEDQWYHILAILTKATENQSNYKETSDTMKSVEKSSF